jgi:hypothetical protein
MGSEDLIGGVNREIESPEIINLIGYSAKVRFRGYIVSILWLLPS